MCLVINKCVTAVKVSNFSGRYLRNRSTLDIGVLGYIGIVQHKEHLLKFSPFLLGHLYTVSCDSKKLHFSGTMQLYIRVAETTNTDYLHIQHRHSVLCEVQAEFLYVMQMSVSLQRLKATAPYFYGLSEPR